MSVDTGQLKVLASDLRRAGQKLMSEVRPVVNDAGDRVKTVAQAKAAHRTGAMAESVEVTKRGNASAASAEIRATSRYAWFNEYGTGKMAPQPFMWPAVMEVAPEFRSDLEKAAEKGLT